MIWNEIWEYISGGVHKTNSSVEIGLVPWKSRQNTSFDNLLFATVKLSPDWCQWNGGHDIFIVVIFHWK